MKVSVEDFPLEVWMEVATHLTIQDTLTLRAVSKKVNKCISQKHIWKELCKQRWLNRLSQEEEIFREPKFLRRSYDDSEDWCYTFRKSYHAENHIHKKIERLASTQQMSTYSSRFDIILKNKWDTLMPVLASYVDPQWLHDDPEVPHTEKHGWLADRDPTQGRYDLYTIGQQILQNLRHERIFKILWCTSPILELGGDNVEPFFLELAMMDPSYDRLAGSVLKVRENIRERLLDDVKSMAVFGDLDVKSKVRKISDALFYVLSNGNPTGWSPQEKLYNEDLMLPRIYAGETNGHPFMILVIMQSLCRIFGIETIITQFYLIVKINEEGESNSILLNYPFNSTEPQFYTREALGRLLGLQNHVDEEFIREQIIPGILTPLTVNTCRSLFFEDLVKDCTGSWTTESNSENSVDIRVDWEEYNQKFSRSRSPLLDSTLQYFTEMNSLAKEIYFDLVDEPVAFEFQTIKRSRHYNSMLRLTKRMNPWDCNHIFSHGIVSDKMTYLIWLQEYCKATIYPEDIGNTNKIGTLAMFNHTEYVCIVSSEYLRHGQLHVTCLRATGQFIVERTELLDYKQPRKQTMVYFANMAGPTGSLGLFFKCLNKKKNRFLLNDRIMSFGKPIPESPGGMIAFDENNKPIL